jgi:hypothetical protein
MCSVSSTAVEVYQNDCRILVKGRQTKANPNTKKPTQHDDVESVRPAAAIALIPQQYLGMSHSNRI